MEKQLRCKDCVHFDWVMWPDYMCDIWSPRGQVSGGRFACSEFKPRVKRCKECQWLVPQSTRCIAYPIFSKGAHRNSGQFACKRFTYKIK